MFDSKKWHMDLMGRCSYFSFVALFIFLIAGTAATYSQDLEGINCALTPDQILGQAFAATAGAEGETADEGTTPEGVDIEEQELVMEPEWIVDNLQYGGVGSNPVAILIVDDFSEEGTDEDTAPSHGWLVYQVFTALRDQLPQEAADLIRLEQVNIAGETGYRSDLIISVLEETIDQLSDEGYERFVVNMSFVFIPCRDDDRDFDFSQFLENREDVPGYSVIEELGGNPGYFRTLLEDPRVTYIEEDGVEIDETPEQSRGRVPSGGPPEFVEDQVEILRFFEDSSLQSDPLRDFFRSADVLVFPVASSGNFKWRRPFFPARWQEVVSVSASEGNDKQRWLHSNDGEVSAPGAWFQFEDEVYRAGTSFAAPVVSMMVALDLTQDNPQCGVRGNMPELTHGRYENPPLSEAVEDRC